MGVESEKRLPALAADAAKQWTGGFNPRPVDADSLESIYQHALPDRIWTPPPFPAAPPDRSARIPQELKPCARQKTEHADSQWPPLTLLMLAGCPARPGPTSDATDVRPEQNENAPINANVVPASESESAARVPANADESNVAGSSAPESTEIALADIPETMPIIPAIAAEEETWAPVPRRFAFERRLRHQFAAGETRRALAVPKSRRWRFRDHAGRLSMASCTSAILTAIFALRLTRRTATRSGSSPANDGFVASPSVYEGHVYIGDLDGKLLLRQRQERPEDCCGSSPPMPRMIRRAQTSTKEMC